MDQGKSNDVARYIAAYLSLEVQSADEGTVDPQLATLILSIASAVSSTDEGAILDVGCGSGALLTRLAELEAFAKKPEWVYVAVDDDQRLNEVQTLARKLRLSRRVELVELADFRTSWPRVASPQIVVCRNVLHELNIRDTSKLLNHIASNISDHDRLYIQDLLRLPAGERHSACWMPNELTGCLTNFGFESISLVTQRTRSGNAYFNIECRKNRETQISDDDSQALVAQARLNQWQLWDKIENGPKTDEGRSELLQALDIDLQLAALTRQLRDSGELEVQLSQPVQKRVRNVAFATQVSALAKSDLPPAEQVEGPSHFRERGAQLNSLEEFLRSDARLAVVHGGSGTGKTTLVRRLLATRSYGKTPVIIDGRRTKGLWSFLEDFLSQLGLRLEPDILSALDNLSLGGVEPALRELFNAHSSNIILFYDNFFEAMDTNGNVADEQLSSVLALLLERQGSKVILASRTEIVPASLQRASQAAPLTVRVGRYGTRDTVVNVLDDYFDRKAAGIEEYPESLIEAIDRHPLICTLAAQTLQKFGRDILLDQRFITELKAKLREALWNRLVDDKSRPAIRVASQLRVAVPRSLLAGLVSDDIISAAHEAELLHARPDQRWKNLWSVLGLFRVREVSDNVADAQSSETPKDAGVIDHNLVAHLYREIYRVDDDPKWIRESYFHRILSDNADATKLSQGLGRYYFDEIVASADYLFVRQRDYASALGLYLTAASMGELREQAAMRQASCLIRTHRRAEGEKLYRKLVERFPHSVGVRTSHVDALLYVQDFGAAERALKNYAFEPSQGEWKSWQWSRVYFGQERYREAIDVLTSLVAIDDPDPHYFVLLTRSLVQDGRLIEAIQAAAAGGRRFPENVAIQTEHGVTLELAGNVEQALPLLEGQVLLRDDNVRAAISLTRMYVKIDRTEDAKALLRQLSRTTPDNYRHLLPVISSEIAIGSGTPDVALLQLQDLSKDDILIDQQAFRSAEEWVKSTPDAERMNVLRQVQGNLPKKTHETSAPIQQAKARLAILAGNRAEFDLAIQNLRKTKLDDVVIKELLAEWSRVRS